LEFNLYPPRCKTLLVKLQKSFKNQGVKIRNSVTTTQKFCHLANSKWSTRSVYF